MSNTQYAYKVKDARGRFVEGKVEAMLRAQIERIHTAEDVTAVAPMRNPWME